jgi:molybdopterin molybdotransferase
MITVEQASKILEQAAGLLDITTVPLDQALGRVLAADIPADRDLPPTDRSAMDGFAVRAADLSAPEVTLQMIGEVRAGQDPAGMTVESGQAVRIMTGATVPAGADSVVMVELTSEDRDEGTVLIREMAKQGQHIRLQGEDIQAGEVVLTNGRSIRAAEMAALASVGAVEVPVYRQPVVHVLTTGDEIVEPHVAPLAHQVRNSNAVTLLSQLKELGLNGRYLGIAADDRAGLREKLLAGTQGDLLILTGGVSMGEYDLVADALDEIGMELLFHKVKVKPGKPILVGKAGSCLVAGLPGNPVSAFTGLAIFLAPFLRRIGGRSEWENFETMGRLAAPLKARPGRVTFHLVEAGFEEGSCVVRPAASRGSGDATSMPRANAFAVTDGGPGSSPEGTRVRTIFWNDPR